MYPGKSRGRIAGMQGAVFFLHDADGMQEAVFSCSVGMV